jgi:hypothetical protein
MQEGWRRLMRTLAAYGEVSIELSVDVQEEPQLAFHDHWASRFGRAHELWRLLAALALRRLHCRSREQTRPNSVLPRVRYAAYPILQTKITLDSPPSRRTSFNTWAVLAGYRCMLGDWAGPISQKPSRSRARHIFISRPGTRTGRFWNDILYREFRSHHKLAPPAVIAAIQPFVAQPASEK